MRTGTLKSYLQGRRFNRIYGLTIKSIFILIALLLFAFEGNEEKSEMKLLGRDFGHDPQGYATADEMYKKNYPKLNFDNKAKNLIATVDVLVKNYTGSQTSTLSSKLKEINPYLGTKELQNAINRWAAALSSTLKNYSTGKETKTKVDDSFYEKGQFDKAIVEYDRYLKKVPMNLDVRNNLALTLMHLDNDAAAQIEFEVLRKLKPNYTPAAINLSVLFERIGLSKPAIEIADSLYDKNKEIPLIVFNYAWFQNIKGKNEQAFIALNSIEDSFPKPKYRELYSAALDGYYTATLEGWEFGKVSSIGLIKLLTKSDFANYAVLIAILYAILSFLYFKYLFIPFFFSWITIMLNVFFLASYPYLWGWPDSPVQWIFILMYALLCIIMTIYGLVKRYEKSY